MTSEEWKELLDTVGVRPNQVDFVIWQGGPIIITKENDANYVIVTQEQWDEVNQIWPEVVNLIQ